MFYCSICFYLLTNQFLGSDGSSNKLENNKVSKALFSEYHITQRTLVPWSPWNLLHQALIWLAFALLQLVLRLVMNVLSWCLEAILLPLPCFSLQRQGSYQLNEQTLESKHVFSIFFHGYGSLQYTVGWDV